MFVLSCTVSAVFREHTYIHTYINTYIHTYIHTEIHTVHTYMMMDDVSFSTMSIGSIADGCDCGQ